jgi:glycosyltransferase involved in cell wall biosynthesis
MARVHIDPMANIYYASFYLKGLYDLFGKRNVLFTSSPFKDLKNRKENFNFVVSNSSKEKRFSISYDDSHEIKKECYEWCDQYGSVNSNRNKTPQEYQKKLIPLAPCFGIRLWNIKDTIGIASTNYFKTNQFANFRKFVGKYKRQYKYRLPISRYYPVKPEDNFLFHVSTLWPSDEWVRNNDYVNRMRAVFIKTCKSIPDVHFEGGFYYNRKFPLLENFNDMVYEKYMPIHDYIEKTKRSFLVFNTPAWLNCNGWKLGEYLALGKAIVSSPLVNDLPEPLIHGENVHFVSDDPFDIKDAIIFIHRNSRYRDKIASGAYQYFMRNASPVKSLELLGVTY